MTRVREFHEAFGLPVGDRPALRSAKDIDLRWKLINEEQREVADALAEIIRYLRGQRAAVEVDLLTDLAKELADLLYVIEGTAVEFGVPIHAVFKIVHQSNMSKLGADGKPIYREDGKVLKGPGYEPAEPRIRELLVKCRQTSHA